MREGGASERERLTFAFRQALTRAPRDEELQILTDFYQQQRTLYAADKAAAEQLLKVGDAVVPEGLDRTDLAAWTAVARAIFNLHEMVTRIMNTARSSWDRN